MLLKPDIQRECYAIHCREQREAARRDRQVRWGPLVCWVFTAAFWYTVFLWVW